MANGYIAEIFEPTLLMSLFSGLVGVSAAIHYGGVNAFLASLALIGAVLTQISVNLFDDYIDYLSGLDKESLNTKFSGGSVMLTKGIVKPRNVLYIGLGAVAVAGIIGIYLAYLYPIIIPIIIIGAIAIFAYAKYIVRIPFLAELTVMASFFLIALGCFIVAHGSASNLGNAIFALISAGIPCGIALLVNSIPDKVVDKRYGRKNGAIIIGKSGNIAYYYLFFELVIYALLISGMLLKALPLTFIIGFFTIPIIYKTFKGIQSYKNPKSFERYMGINTLGTVIILVLLSVAYLV